MSKNKRFFIILLLTFILLLFSVSSCFAVYLPSSMENFNDSNGYYIVFKDIEGNYFLVTTKTQLNYQDYGDYCVFWNAGGSVNIYEWQNDNWIFRTGTSNTSVSYLVAQRNNSCLRVDDYGSSISLVASSYDISFTQNLSNVFFQKTPLGIVARQVEKVQTSQVMKEIVGLLPLVIGLLVSVIGLKKGLQILFQILRNS